MSLFSKFTSLFHSKSAVNIHQTELNKFQEILNSIMGPYVQFDLKQMTKTMAQYLTTNDSYIDSLFSYMQEYKPSPGSTALIQLLAVIHQMFHCTDITQEISIKLKDCRIKQIEQQDSDNLVTEPDLMTRMKHEQFYTEMNVSEDLSITQFTYAYFSYLQRLAANIDLYRAACRNSYPYLSDKDQVEPKLMFLWHYKMQNLINSAAILLKSEMNISEIQKYIYFDVWRFQSFICFEVEKIIDKYITLPNSDALSLYEIYSESKRHYDQLLKFKDTTKRLKLQIPVQCQIENNELQEFLNFVSRLKVLNQMAFKKSLKVPNKQNPCMGIPQKNPQVRFNVYFSYFIYDPPQANIRMTKRD
ncbi:unnamed protein product (macronuclear) [Paramecium tetraurelia]|uniref:Uncharacterized protein n=1 Tax=Paramecium tetraurelia TaxID=5888 RepID=A0BUP5_PARTE|nr:uncharacterized protein GSPATT00005508001 [Paramecium tetraurelia]CAK62262.1 unnamed protein product [Paramecium tetraurelia]|eukprot:XP_001429660.1 hypothetical protein (macronuclear) [Paramecium tetraurelia strain d4-2]